MRFFCNSIRHNCLEYRVQYKHNKNIFFLHFFFLQLTNIKIIQNVHNKKEKKIARLEYLNKFSINQIKTRVWYSILSRPHATFASVTLPRVNNKISLCRLWRSKSLLLGKHIELWTHKYQFRDISQVKKQVIDGRKRTYKANHNICKTKLSVCYTCEVNAKVKSLLTSKPRPYHKAGD